MANVSAFLDPGPKSAPGQLAIALLAKDSFQPITLQKFTGAVDGYAEGAVMNTRFGSFPHSTLLDIPWGSQVRASHVDTGARGRKRKLVDTAGEDDSTGTPDQEASPATNLSKRNSQPPSGFIHILRPSPELWTSSLPHRTQVVYTPDYSYVLHRIRARPGTRLIEAGAGSGSFTHASVRAVYNGYPQAGGPNKGKVFSFEYHEPRYEAMKEEIAGHQLEELVHITHRDVYNGGFLIDGESPQASAIFLDLPAPWEAIYHLSRRKTRQGGELAGDGEGWVSPLDPNQSAYICTFSPCIEQVIRTVEELRRQGWLEVDMVEIQHRRLYALKERVGVNLPTERGYNQNPADVGEALAKLREIKRKTAIFNKNQEAKRNGTGATESMDIDESEPRDNTKNGANGTDEDDKIFMQGRTIHRPEGEFKTHTSYLVFAILPPEWSEEDEEAAAAKWPCGQETKTIGIDKETRRQEKRDLLEQKKEKKKQRKADRAEAPKDS